MLNPSPEKTIKGFNPLQKTGHLLKPYHRFWQMGTGFNNQYTPASTGHPVTEEFKNSRVSA